MPLVAHDNRWAVCMPKKTGSHTLVHYFNPRQWVMNGPDLAEIYGDWHGTELPEEFNGSRIMIARDPLDRLASMFWYGRKCDVVFRYCQDVSDWLELFLSCDWSADGGIVLGDGIPKRFERIMAEYTPRQADLRDAFQPDEIYHFESGLEGLARRLGLDCQQKLIRRNTGAECLRNRVRPTTRQTFKSVSPRLRSRVEEWCEKDFVSEVVA